MVSVDFLTVPTLRFHVLYVLLVLSHARRKVPHFNVTAFPSALWTAQQLREAFAFTTQLQVEVLPHYLVEFGRRQSLDGVVQREEDVLVSELANRCAELVTVDLDGLLFHCYNFSIRRSIPGRFEYRRRNPASFWPNTPRSPACS